jgi:hypothetical protein
VYAIESLLFVKKKREKREEEEEYQSEKAEERKKGVGLCVGSLSSAKGIKSAKVGGTEAFALCRPPRPLDWFPTLAIRRQTRPTGLFLDEENPKNKL